jgi:hypothetical protein
MPEADTPHAGTNIASAPQNHRELGEDEMMSSFINTWL